MAASPARRLDRPTLSTSIDAIAEAAYQGAGSELAARWTADAARELGDGRDKVRVLSQLADRVRAAVAFAPDEYAGENVQPVEETILPPEAGGRGAGDCDDLTVAMLALGRRAGLRGAAVVFEEERGGQFVPTHVLPAFEEPERPGEWIPVELSREIPFGRWPAMGEGRWTTYPMQEGIAPTLADIFSTIVGGALSLFGIDSGADAAKKAAKETRKGQEAIARATVEANKTAAASAERIAALQAAEIEKGLAFGREALAMLYKLGLLAAGVAVVNALSRPSPRAPSAPRQKAA